MNAFLLCAGLGSRLKPLTNNCPKCLVKLGDSNLLDMWIHKLKNIDVKNIYINAYFLKEKIIDHIYKKYHKDKNIKIIIEDQLYGTGGSLIKNIDKFIYEDLILIHSDNFCIDDLFSFIHQSKKNNYLINLMAHNTNNPSECGIIELNEDSVMVNFYEKVKNPPGNLANSAIFILKKKFLNSLKQNKSYYNDFIDFSKEILPNYVNKSKVYVTNEYFEDIGTITNYKKVINYLKNVHKNNL